MVGLGMGDIDLDVKRLRRDVAKRQAARPVGLAPGGRRPTGSMAIVRQHLGELDRLRAAGATWTEIAAGLTGQGVTQGEGAPLTAKRLTALVTLVRKAEAKRAATLAKRSGRSDAPPALASPPLTLSPDLVRSKRADDFGTAASEEANRHTALARSKALLKDR